MTRASSHRLAAASAALASAVLALALAVAGCAGSRPDGPVTGLAAVPGPLAAAPAGAAPSAPVPPPRVEVAAPTTEAGPAPASFDALLAGAEAVAATAAAGEGGIDAWAQRPGTTEPGPSTWTIPVVNEFGGPAHFRVLDEHDGWLLVQLPVRPNGSQGWIRSGSVTMSAVGHRVEVALGQRTLRVFEGATLVLEATVAVGRPSAATPVGDFYLRDSFAWDPSSVYGPYVLPLSGFSESIDVINGGDAVIAIHGTNRPEALGRAASLGCIRVDNDTVTQLAHLLLPGTPVTILA